MSRWLNQQTASTYSRVMISSAVRYWRFDRFERALREIGVLFLASHNSLTLRNPFWIASAHYTHKDSVIRAWKEFEPAALTLKTTHRYEGAEDKPTIRQKTDQLLRRFGKSFYCDGPKQEELLSYAQAAELLKVAADELPNTVVGTSVLAHRDQDYAEVRRQCGSAKFCELNLKYSFRIASDNADFPGVAAQMFEAALAEIKRFCGAYAGLPVFIKIPREMFWLPGSKQLGEIIGTLRQHGKAGLIFANSLKLDIPTFLAEGTEKTLRGGVMCGECLFDGTVALIERSRQACTEAGIPVVASGGMISPEQILVALRAGASAAQLCTASEYHGLNYSRTLAWNLQARIESRGLRNFGDYLHRLREEGIASIYSMPFMYFSNFWDEEFQKRIQSDVRLSTRLDVFVMSGKTLSENWAEPFRHRFKNNRGLRLLVPRVDGDMYMAIQKSWGLSELEVSARKERVSLAKENFQRLWDDTATDREGKTEKPVFRIYETDKCPFYSFYISDDKVYVAPYPFDRPGELSSPVYVFPAGSSEYDRIRREAETLIGFAQQSEPLSKPA
jgi:dihydroorotate dehydrogenase